MLFDVSELKIFLKSLNCYVEIEIYVIARDGKKHHQTGFIISNEIVISRG